MLITMVQFPASYLIHVPRYDVSFIWHLEAKCFELHVHTYSTYVGIGMIQSWTIAICMNGTFKWCLFLILSPNTNKGITNGFDSVRYSQITMHQKKWTKEIQSGRHGNTRYFPYTQSILTSNMYILTRLLYEIISLQQTICGCVARTMYNKNSVH